MAHLFVIAGHGAGDPGACANGFSEAERVRALATRIKALGGDRVTLGTLTEIIMQTMVSVALTSRMTGKSRNCTWTVQQKVPKAVMSLSRQDLLRISTTMPLQVLLAVFTGAI